MTNTTPPNGPAQSMSPARTRLPWKESFNWIGFVAAAIFLVIIVGLELTGPAMASGSASEFSMARIAGGLAAGYFIAALFSWIGHAVSRGSRTVTNITFVFLLLLVCLGAVSNRVRSASNREAFARFEQEVAADRQDQIEFLDRVIAGEDVSAEQAEWFASGIERVERLSTESTGMDSKVMGAAARVMRRIEQPMNEYNAAMDRFMQAGSMDAATMIDATVIPERLKMIDEFAAANEKLSQAYALLEGELRKELAALSIDARRIDFFIGKWKQGAQPELIEQIRQTDRDLAEHFRVMVTLLGDTHGRWSLEDDSLIFEDDAKTDEYNEHFELMQVAAARQEQLQRQVQGVLRGGQINP